MNLLLSPVKGRGLVPLDAGTQPVKLMITTEVITTSLYRCFLIPIISANKRILLTGYAMIGELKKRELDLR